MKTTKLICLLLLFPFFLKAQNNFPSGIKINTSATIDKNGNINTLGTIRQGSLTIPDSLVATRKYARDHAGSGGGTWPSDSIKYESKSQARKDIHDSIVANIMAEVDPVVGAINGIVYSNGSGTISPVTIGSNLTFSGGTLNASGGSGSIDSIKMKSVYQSKLDTTKLHNQIAAKLNTSGTAANSSLLQGRDSTYIKAHWGGTGGNDSTKLKSIYQAKLDTTKLHNEIILKANTSSLATVATSGSYTDLINKPSIITTDGNNNLVMASTLGTELMPALTSGNWTLGAGWQYLTGPNRLNKFTTGASGSITTPVAASGIKADTTYKVVIVVDAVTAAVGFTYTTGGSTGTLITTAGTYTDYITAINTNNFQISANSSGYTIVISSISVKPLQNAGLSLDGHLKLKSPIQDNNGNNLISLTGGFIGIKNYSPLYTLDVGGTLAVTYKGSANYSATFNSTSSGGMNLFVGNILALQANEVDLLKSGVNGNMYIYGSGASHYLRLYHDNTDGFISTDGKLQIRPASKIILEPTTNQDTAWNLRTAGGVSVISINTNNPSLANNATQTTVSGSTSGNAVFSQPESGKSIKRIIVYLNALNGTASYTFPIAFTNQPSVIATNDVVSTVVTSRSTTAITITGATTTGFIELIGY